MIREKKKLTGNLNTKQSLNGSLSNSVVYVSPITQEKEVTPTREIQEITPDIGYTGLSKVKVNGYTVKTAEKTVVENGIYNAPDENLDGYSKVKVAVNNSIFSGSYDRTGLKQIGWTDEEIDYYNDNGVQWNEGENDFFKLNSVELEGDDSSDTRFLPKNTTKKNFQNYYKLLALPSIDFSNLTSLFGVFSNCYSLTALPQLDTSNITSVSAAFGNCYSLETIPQLDTSKVITMEGMFRYCYSLKTIPQLNTSKVTSMTSMFNVCNSLKTIPQLDTSNVISMNSMFSGCNSLTALPQLDTSNVITVRDMFNGCRSLTTLNGLLNLGQAYLTTASANFPNYTLNLSSPKLTEQSIMNVLNNLYDIATKGCNAQEIQLGSANIAKLTSEEGQTALSNAQTKGWTVS